MSTPSLTTDAPGEAPPPERRLVLLSGDTAAGVTARRHVVQVMIDGGVDDDTVGDVELLVSEVVGNFLQHEQPHEIDVDVAVSREHAVTVVVTGGVSDPSLPVVFGAARPSDTSDSGRGLRLLDTLTTTWGTRRRHATTSLWFSVGGDGAGPDNGSRRTAPPVSAAQIQQVELSLGVSSAAQDAAYTVAMAVFPGDSAAAAALFEASALTAAAASRAGRTARAAGAIARAVATAALPPPAASTAADLLAEPVTHLHRASTRLRDAVDEFDRALEVGLALPELVRRDTEVAAASTQCLVAAIACHTHHGG